MLQEFEGEEAQRKEKKMKDDRKAWSCFWFYIFFLPSLFSILCVWRSAKATTLNGWRKKVKKRMTKKRHYIGASVDGHSPFFFCNGAKSRRRRSWIEKSFFLASKKERIEAIPYHGQFAFWYGSFGSFLAFHWCRHRRNSSTEGGEKADPQSEWEMGSEWQKKKNSWRTSPTTLKMLWTV